MIQPEGWAFLVQGAGKGKYANASQRPSESDGGREQPGWTKSHSQPRERESTAQECHTQVSTTVPALPERGKRTAQELAKDSCAVKKKYEKFSSEATSPSLIIYIKV